MDRWTYPNSTEPPPDRPPSWDCPEGLCTCKPSLHLGASQFSVLLCNEHGERMPGARYRVMSRGVVVEDACADNFGWANVDMSRAQQFVWIEWAPSTMPQSPRFPFRQRYVVAVEAHEQPNLHRLHNLGFWVWSRTSRNVRSFKQRYELTRDRGELSDVEAHLKSFHDAALLPTVTPAGQVTVPPPPSPPPLQPAGVLQPPPPALFLTFVDTSSNAMGNREFSLSVAATAATGTLEVDGALPFDVYRLGTPATFLLSTMTTSAGRKELGVELNLPEHPGRYTLWLQSWYA